VSSGWNLIWHVTIDDAEKRCHPRIVYLAGLPAWPGVLIKNRSIPVVPTVLEASAVLDVAQGRVINDAYVRVVDDKIHSWGALKDRPPLPPDAIVSSFPLQTILPGLINSHAHLCLPSGGQPFHLRQTDEMALLTAVRNMGRERRSGVTTVRDCGDQNGVLFSLRKAVDQDILDGPRLILCGPPMTMTDGHAHFLGGVADGPLEISRAVRRRIADSADFIKLIGTGGGTRGTRPGHAAYSCKELSAAVAVARKVDIPVTVHCRGIPGIVNALDAGVDQIEHACFERPDGSLTFDPELAGRMAQTGTYITPTIQLYRDMLAHMENKAADHTLNESEETVLKSLPDAIDAKLLALQGFMAAGVPVVAGNDAGLPYTEFGFLWQELDAMVMGGMTAIEAITAATQTAARAVRMEDEIGSIKSGKQADLLIVDGDPTTEISALSNVRMVMQAGRMVFHQGDQVSK
jgi:imidazolonepropionase-like amidohydrolase